MDSMDSVEQIPVTIFAQMIQDGVGDVSNTRRILDVCDRVERIFLMFGDTFNPHTITPPHTHTTTRMFSMLDELEEEDCGEKYILHSLNKELSIARWTPMESRSISDWYKTLNFSVMEASDILTDRVIMYNNSFSIEFQTLCVEKRVLQLGDPHTVGQKQLSLLHTCTNPKWTLVSDDVAPRTIEVHEDQLQFARSVAENLAAPAEQLRDQLKVIVNRPFRICLGFGQDRYWFKRIRLTNSGLVDEYVSGLCAAEVPVLFAYSVRNRSELLMFLRECAMCIDGHVFPFDSFTLIAPKYITDGSSSLTVSEVKTVSGNEITIVIDTHFIPSHNLIDTCHFLNERYNLPIGVTGADTMLESLNHGIHCVYCCANRGVMQLWFTFMIHVFGLNSGRVSSKITGVFDDDPRRIPNVRFPWQYDEARAELVDFASTVYKRLAGMTKEERRKIYEGMGTRSLEEEIAYFLIKH